MVDLLLKLPATLFASVIVLGSVALLGSAGVLLGTLVGLVLR